MTLKFEEKKVRIYDMSETGSLYSPGNVPKVVFLELRIRFLSAATYFTYVGSYKCPLEGPSTEL